MAESRTKLSPKPFITNTTRKSLNNGQASQLIFNFFEEGDVSSDGSSWGSSDIGCDKLVQIPEVADEEEEEDEDEKKYASKAEAAKAFWVSQEELLLATLRRTSSFESKVRKATKDAVKELKSSVGEGNYCACRETVVVDGCRKCKQEQICRRLQEGGYSCYICKSKWKSSPGIPAGEHTYMEVVETSSSKKGEVKVIIELNFQAEYVVAKACEEYSRLVSRLPEIFVGKQERMKALVKILCCALKKCLKSKKMHMAPWRKQKYMQAKWVGKHNVAEKTQETEILPYGNDHFERLQRPKASMLTFEFLDNLPAGLNLVPMIKVL